MTSRKPTPLADLVFAYRDGASVREVAARFGLCYGTAYNRLHDAGVLRTPVQAAQLVRERRADDNHRCEPITDEAGEVIAVAHMDPDAPPETRAALGALVEAARRQFEADVPADPSILTRQAASRARIAERNARLRGGAT